MIRQPSSSSPLLRWRRQLFSISELPLAPRPGSFLGLVEPFQSPASDAPFRSDHPRSLCDLSNGRPLDCKYNYRLNHASRLNSHSQLARFRLFYLIKQRENKLQKMPALRVDSLLRNHRSRLHVDGCISHPDCAHRDLRGPRSLLFPLYLYLLFHRSIDAETTTITITTYQT